MNQNNVTINESEIFHGQAQKLYPGMCPFCGVFLNKSKTFSKHHINVLLCAYPMLLQDLLKIGFFADNKQHAIRACSPCVKAMNKFYKSLINVYVDNEIFFKCVGCRSAINTSDVILFIQDQPVVRFYMNLCMYQLINLFIYIKIRLSRFAL